MREAFIFGRFPMRNRLVREDEDSLEEDSEPPPDERLQRLLSDKL